MAVETDEERTVKQKISIEKMRGAQGAMQDALARITSLERALAGAVSALQETKGYISPKVYCYPSGSATDSVHARIDSYIANAQKAL